MPICFPLRNCLSIKSEVEQKQWSVGTLSQAFLRDFLVEKCRTPKNDVTQFTNFYPKAPKSSDDSLFFVKAEKYQIILVVMRYYRIKFLINNLCFSSGRRKASASSYISTNDKCFVLANICRRLICSTFLLFSLISHSLLEVWSRRFCFVACQEGIQEEAATTQGKKVSRTVIFFISSKYLDWDLCAALVVSKAVKILSHLRTTLSSDIEKA